MSYGHSWSWEKPLADREIFRWWSHDIDSLLEEYPFYPNHWYWEGAITSSPLPKNWSRKKICGPMGRGVALITDIEVAFNGQAATQNDHEAFRITVEDLQKPQGSMSCRTNCRPYDLLVTAALIRLRYYFPELHLSGDGGAKGFQQGAQFCREVLGVGVNPELQYISEPDAFDAVGGTLYPSLQYLNYILAWYQHVHPFEHIRYATFTEKVRTEASVGPKQTPYFDVINDSQHMVWDVMTGGAFPPLRNLGNGYVLTKAGTPFPDPATLTNKVARLLRHDYASISPYQPGTPDGDQALQKQACFDHRCTVYFNDGTMMLVTIPSKTEATATIAQQDARGIITYSIAQTPLVHQKRLQVIDEEEYREKYSRTLSSINERVKTYE